MKQQVTKTPIAIALGSNIENRLEYLSKASAAIASWGEPVFQSRVYETVPVDSPSNDLFLNAVIKTRVQMSPEELLRKIQIIEKEFGRIRTVLNGPRTIDLDILFFGDALFENENLTIPHPRMTSRLFVMIPLRDVWQQDSIFPGSERSLRFFLDQAMAHDKTSVPQRRFDPPW